MKSRIILITSVLLALTSCGTTASFTQADSQQKYQDGIYYRPQSLSLDAQASRLTETDDLIARTKSSAVFVKTIGKVDTLLIPDNMSATFKFNHRDSTTTVSLYDDDDYWYDRYWNFYPSYSFHRWHSPFWGPGYWRTWSLGWYDPFWHDPFWGPSWSWGFGPYWADPFYYAGYWGGWYDPFFYDPFFYYGGPIYMYGGGGWHSSRHIYDRELATRGFESGMARQPRAGVGRVVRTGASSSASARNSASGSGAAKLSSAPRVASATRTVSSATRSAANASASRATGISRGTASSAGTVSRPSGSSVSRSAGSSSASTYRRSSSGSGSSTYRSSGSVSRSSSYGSSPSRSSSSSSYSPSRSSSSYSTSRSSGGFSSGGSYSSGSSHSSGGYSGGGASRGGAGRR